MQALAGIAAATASTKADASAGMASTKQVTLMHTCFRCREEPLSVSMGLGIEEHDQEGRVITAEYSDFYGTSHYPLLLSLLLNTIRILY